MAVCVYGKKETNQTTGKSHNHYYNRMKTNLQQKDYFQYYVKLGMLQFEVHASEKANRFSLTLPVKM